MNNVMWQNQRLITRWRMRGEQATYWFRSGLSIWILGVILSLFIGLRATEAKNTVPWIISSLASPILPTWGVRWQGEEYEARELASYLSAEFYNGTFWQWLLWAGVLGLIPTGAAGLIKDWYVRRQGTGELHIRGAKVISVKELRQRVREEGAGTIQLGGVPIPTELERRHTLICGSTGSGKSNTLHLLMQQFEREDVPCIIVDPAWQLTSHYYRPTRGDIILNPLYDDCPTWTPWMEGDREEEIAAQGASWFPIFPGMSDTAKYYHEQAQVHYSNLLLHARVHDVWHIPEMLNEEIQKKGARFGSPQVVTTLQNALKSLRYLRPGSREWTAREWVANPKGWIFLTFRKKESAAVRPLISFWFECLVRELLSTEESPTLRARIIIEELAALGPVPTVADLMSEGRKYGVPVTIAFQDVNQLNGLYGEFAKTILNQPTLRLLMLSNDSATQQWCSENIGRQEIQRPVEVETAGSVSTRDAVTRSHQRRESDVVLASEFGLLPTGSAYFRVGPYGTTKLHLPFLPFAINTPALLPRTERGNRGSEREKARGEQVVREQERRLL